ncbi:MAG: flippase-like domain-containing protein [Fibrobacter sp.]|nr:flippase-like domain-containing protein [Fibrobacter sp.]
MKFPIKTVLGILGIGAAIAWSIKGVDFREVGTILKQMDVTMTLGVLVLTTINLLIRAYVWKFIVNPIKRVPIGHAVSSYLIGVFSNLFLPFKLGDVAQGYTLGRREDVSKISAVSAVLIQRAFEISSLILVMLSMAMFFSIPLLFQRRTLLAGLLIMTGIAGLFIMFRKREVVISAVESFLGRISRKLAISVSRGIDRFLAGTKAMHNFSDVVKILSFSLLSWLVQIMMVWLTASALDISIDIAGSSIVLLIINLGLTIPLAPGNIGTFQVFSIIALSLFSVAKPKALTFSIIFQVIQGIPVIIGGGLSLLHESRKNTVTGRDVLL